MTTHSNVNPETDIQNNWVVAFEGSGNSLLKVNNLSDVPDKAQARINLGIATTEFYDGRYLLRSSNLSDVPNKATARNNLGLGNSSTCNVGTTAGTVAAGDDQRITWAVQSPRRITAGNGLVGGGDLWADRTISLGIPSFVSATSQNTVSGNTHSHALDLSSIVPLIMGTSVQNVTGARGLGGTYQNNRNKFISVYVTSNRTNDQASLDLYINGEFIFTNAADMINGVVGISFTVPPWASYRVTGSGMTRWVEVV